MESPLTLTERLADCSRVPWQVPQFVVFKKAFNYWRRGWLLEERILSSNHWLRPWKTAW